MDKSYQLDILKKFYIENWFFWGFCLTNKATLNWRKIRQIPLLVYLLASFLDRKWGDSFLWSKSKWINLILWILSSPVYSRVSQNKTFSYFQKAQFGLRFYCLPCFYTDFRYFPVFKGCFLLTIDSIFKIKKTKNSNSRHIFLYITWQYLKNFIFLLYYRVCENKNAKSEVKEWPYKKKLFSSSLNIYWFLMNCCNNINDLY